MPLDPQSRFLLDQLAAQGGPQLHEMSPAQARQAFEAMRIPAPGESVAATQDLRLPGPAGEIPARLYVPEGAAAASGALVYFHGGGWVIGSLETHENLCKALANRSGARVVSVDYRLAPEHRWPAAAEDCYAAACQVAENGATLGIEARASRSPGTAPAATWPPWWRCWPASAAARACATRC